MVWITRSDDLEAHVAPGDGPFVVLFGEHCTDEPDDGPAVGKDPHDVGTSSDLLVLPQIGRASCRERV